jgi:hypothetical protein
VGKIFKLKNQRRAILSEDDQPTVIPIPARATGVPESKAPPVGVVTSRGFVGRAERLRSCGTTIQLGTGELKPMRWPISCLATTRDLEVPAGPACRRVQ